MSKSLKVFIIYSHKDAAAKDKLITCLDVLRNEGLIDVWHDNEIRADDRWRDAISSNLTSSDLLLYLVSVANLTFENCNRELAEALCANIRLQSRSSLGIEHCLNHQPR